MRKRQTTGFGAMISFTVKHPENIPAEAQRYATGATDQLLRLSVGLEDVEDLEEDLKQALSI